MNDQYFMKFALSLARSVSGQTSPNPPVGAVVVKNGQIIGLGAHLKAGEPHAEVHALQMAGDKAEHATIYVTLEPCSHHGKTPPCADLILQKGVSRVVVATVDPNEKVAGQGIKRLRDSGVQVDVGILKEEADSLNKAFFYYIQHHKPFVTLKSATSLDGKLATVTGESQWITGEEARQDVHLYRHTHDAILVGVNTVLNDNPTLTARLPLGGKNPVRVVLDTHLRTPLQSKIITDNDAETWIITGSEARQDTIADYEQFAHVEVIQLNQPKITIPRALEKLGDRKIMTLFVEGGAEVNGSFLKEKAVQQVITYIAPMLIGGRNAPASIGGDGIEILSDSLDLSITSLEKIGKDIKIVAEAKNHDEG
ncbi:bifunctional diaminohydroxyphosphoribosylaminopyrimidine deaminase/5-amino-6-(5-phosphoribosylamino)uracil reductase RibD [Virgibacillus sp. MSP4-1]|uniref:bifunctional diaminohydroxyphosphoribosylaminopyrimidine deaminase/5-amino-6-(5-phosphoribosylamino)uracil reductase RibD n=1 Tax=Virgibacillus sp. MSP4-1 TaxID=2700081 RepID=UPI0003AAB4C3|nr:bifunctional diaminohydroxyphosphoribosylaminopyrimidine deaminase/5-amino-6-(5-phosphoribosylamino)uracil reductase RibD [Virgibacillus sp. MSP4-1]QHS24047.1 bifunctional diaminohydroxyphosphoribosylaminopyrimidine deaminase/5-amino-6-(5-phosphoribosylamino)uracil reductase RibD [Virgibacillus sp. MSP4-1]